MSKFITNPANENETLSIEGCRDEINKLNRELKKKKEAIDEVISLEKYHQKGGTYIIPVEVMNNIFSMIEDKGD